MGARLDWCCFKFWLVWRFLLACLAHFNWAAAFYVNCIYFILWKSYDLLWFWMHLALCICIPQLRADNYLLVFCNLIWKKRTQHPNKTYQQVYKILYSRRFTKSERILRKMDQEDQGVVQADESDDSDDEQAMPTINVDRKPGPSKQVGWRPGLEKEGLLNSDNGSNVPLRNLSPTKEPTTNPLSDASSQKSGGWTHRLQLQTFIPSAFQRSASRDSDNDNASLKAKSKQEKEGEKLRMKDEKKKQKESEKKARQERKEELRRLARIERRHKTIAESVDLMLQCLRSVTSFAILVGNIHRTFLPRAYLAPDKDVYDNPDMLMMFTITLSLDVMLFWFSTFWTYWRQLRLMCRLGFCKFWLWLITLGVLGGLLMYYPMHLVHDQLDLSWCIFRPDTILGQYLDG